MTHWPFPLAVYPLPDASDPVARCMPDSVWVAALYLSTAFELLMVALSINALKHGIVTLNRS